MIHELSVKEIIKMIKEPGKAITSTQYSLCSTWSAPGVVRWESKISGSGYKKYSQNLL